MMIQHRNSEDKIQLSVIVLFYHGERWIQECIQTLQKQSLDRSRYEILLVDNGGSTPSVRNYKGKPNTKVLHFSKNYGFAGGNNKALAHAEGEFVLLMNQDVWVHFNCLEELMVAFEANPQAGIISASMLMISSKKRPNRHGSISKTIGRFKLTRCGYASYMIQETDKNLVPVEFVSGNAMCFRKDMLDNVGSYLFDKRLKSYAEDLDLSIRVQNSNWKMYVRPKALVYHYRDEAFSGSPVERLQKMIHISSNRLFVYYNNYPLGKFCIKLPALLLGIPLKVARPDGSSDFHFMNFLAALTLVPPIFIYFCFRASQSSKLYQHNSKIA
jgi:GT2 family glycosyltransferase